MVKCDNCGTTEKIEKYNIRCDDCQRAYLFGLACGRMEIKREVNTMLEKLRI